MSRIFKGIFGGRSSSEKILQRFQPTGFSSPGLTGRFDKGTNQFNISRTAEGNQTIAGLLKAFKGRGTELRGLRDRVKPGFGELTRTRIDAIRNAGQRTVGNLREELGKRRVLGSTFASREIASTEAEFGRIEEQSRAESFLQELALTGELIKEEFGSLISGFTAILQQTNFETSIGAQLASNASAQLNANLMAQAGAQQAQQEVGDSFINNLLGLVDFSKILGKIGIPVI